MPSPALTVKKQNTAVIDGGKGGHYKRGFNDKDGLFSLDDFGYGFDGGIGGALPLALSHIRLSSNSLVSPRGTGYGGGYGNDDYGRDGFGRDDGKFGRGGASLALSSPRRPSSH